MAPVNFNIKNTRCFHPNLYDKIFRHVQYRPPQKGDPPHHGPQARPQRRPRTILHSATCGPGGRPRRPRRSARRGAAGGLVLRSRCAEQRMLREIGGVLQGSPGGIANMTYSDCSVEALRIINQYIYICLINGMMILVLFADDKCWGGLK